MTERPKSAKRKYASTSPILISLFIILLPRPVVCCTLSDIKAEVREYSIHARLLTATEYVYSLEHTKVSATAFIKCGDFDGNGISDFATILILGDIKCEDCTWDEDIRKKADSWLVVLLRFPKKTKWVFLKRVSDTIPLMNVELETIMPGNIVETESRRKYQNRFKGIELIYLEKSSVAYFWDNKVRHFREVWTSD